MTEFTVNDFITLRLENGKTEIYVLDEEFIQCKFLLMKIPIEEIASLNEIKSIDEAEEKLNSSLETSDPKKYKIDPKTEFWAHCSNLQVWSEQKYHTKFLHRNISFPLLKKLTEIGDQVAKRVFKEEIAKRMEEGNLNVALYLLEERYLKYLTEEEKETVFYDLNVKLKENIEHTLNKEESSRKITSFLSDELDKLVEKIGRKKVPDDFKKKIDRRLKEGNLESALSIFDRKLWDKVTNKEIGHSYYEEHKKSRKSIKKILEEDKALLRIALLVLKELAELGDEKARQRSIKEFEKECERKKLSNYELLVMDGYRYDGINWTRYYEYLDRTTMLHMLLEENDAKAILELDKLIENRWFEFKSSLSYEEEEYPESYRRTYLILRPEYPSREKFEDRDNFTFLIEERRIVDLFLSSEMKFKLLGFPKPILRLSALRKLNLEYNGISKIPEGISNLKELRELNLSSCYTQILSESMGELRRLEKVDLSSNKIEHLPSSFGHLESLRRLDLSNNSLTSFPKQLCNLTSLERLSISNNKVTSLPNEIENLKFLRTIDISYNKIKNLPAAILNLKNLSSIYIDASQEDLYPLNELKKKRKRLHILLQ